MFDCMQEDCQIFLKSSNLVQHGSIIARGVAKQNIHQGYVKTYGIYAGYENHRKLGPLVHLLPPLY